MFQVNKIINYKFNNSFNKKFRIKLNFLYYFAYEINRIMLNKVSKPTENELDILRFLWQNQQASVRAVHEELSKTKDAGYTTTLKLMQIMYEKGLVVRDDSSKVHIYKANITQESIQQQLLPKFIDTLFSGSSTQLVMQTLGNHKPSLAEITEIEQLLNELKMK